MAKNTRSHSETEGIFLTPFTEITEADIQIYEVRVRNGPDFFIIFLPYITQIIFCFLKITKLPEIIMKTVLLSFALIFITGTLIFGQSFRMQRPVKNNIQVNGSYLYGEPHISNPGNAHKGADILVKWDTVYAYGNATVHTVAYNPNDTVGGYEPNGGGNYIVLRSTWEGRQIYVYYMHLKLPLVTSGSAVTAGQPVAISGNTGFSTGAHLHFEIREGSPSSGTSRSRRNPELWFAMPGMGAIYGKVPGASSSTRVDIYPDPKPRPPYTTYGYSLTYNFNDPGIGIDPVYNENYAIGDVKPGTYTISALNGAYRRTVTVAAGQVVNADAATYADDDILPDTEDYLMAGNYPNPFNPETTIEFRLAEAANVRIDVYSSEGTHISTLVNGFINAGKHKEVFNGNRLASGTYFYRISAGDKVISGKMLLLK